MIGIFDSGMGGLTVLTALRAQLPEADFLYYGDIKNAPYGVRSREELTELTVADIQFLQSHGATDIVSACNSVSASLAVSLLDALHLSTQHLVEMVGPTVAHFKDYDGRIALAATPATISSGMYQSAFHMIGKDVMPIPIPPLAGAIEAGAPADEIEGILTEAFLKAPPVYDTLILACTHYPLTVETFKKILGSTVRVFNPAEVVAERAATLFGTQEGSGKISFYISKDSMPFRALVESLFSASPRTIEVV